jgi:hypothetical protein
VNSTIRPFPDTLGVLGLNGPDAAKRFPFEQGRRLMSISRFAVYSLFVIATAGASFASEAVSVDLADYDQSAGVVVKSTGGTLDVAWPMEAGEFGRLVVNLDPARPRFAGIGVGESIGGPWKEILRNQAPALFLTVGTRQAPGNRPLGMSVFNTFFDNPHKREHSLVRAVSSLESVKVASEGRSVRITLDAIQAGPFAGAWQVVVYPDCRLIQLEAAVSTVAENCAFLYDLGMVSVADVPHRMAWVDTEGTLRRATLEGKAPDRAIAVRHRTIVEETTAGSIAVFPPPHSFFFPRDYTDNVHTVWAGSGHGKSADQFGVGIRQDEQGGGNFVPWFNAPPKTEQRLQAFSLLTKGNAESALTEVLKFTHGDRFPEVKDHITFTSHYHMAIAVAALKERAEGRGPNPSPDFVKMFKDMNVNAVHLGEFHGDGHQFDAGPLRLPELDSMFAECKRLSDKNLLMIPGEEVDNFLGFHRPGQQHGHWMCLFPKPVYWIMQRSPDQPFVTADPQRGKVYHVGDTDDMQRLLETEHGLAWTSHPRVKSSVWTPDVFRNESFYKADTWLGAAWKALPADLSGYRLGERALDLMDDMANWGDRKSMPGEVDVFKLDHSHELYGHMNINYLQLDRVPLYEEGWQPILDALRGGRFFTTTGEILLEGFTVGGVPSGGTLKLKSDEPADVQVDLKWTFPLHVVNIVTGDGERVGTKSISMNDLPAFGVQHFQRQAAMEGVRWLRIEAWDVAGNGAFTQPVWIER